MQDFITCASIWRSETDIPAEEKDIKRIKINELPGFVARIYNEGHETERIELQKLIVWLRSLISCKKSTPSGSTTLKLDKKATPAGAINKLDKILEHHPV